MADLKSRVIGGATAIAVGLVVAVSQQGLEAIKEHEGLRYSAYADPQHGWAVPTICYGSTKNVKRGDRASQAECDARLLEDVKTHCAVVYRDLKGTGVILTQGEQDAYCSFTYNTGYFKTNRAGQTTTMYRELLKGNHYAACKGLLLYTKGLPGHITRRQAEFNLCISGL